MTTSKHTKAAALPENQANKTIVFPSLLQVVSKPVLRQQQAAEVQGVPCCAELPGRSEPAQLWPAAEKLCWNSHETSGQCLGEGQLRCQLHQLPLLGKSLSPASSTAAAGGAEDLCPVPASRRGSDPQPLPPASQQPPRPRAARAEDLA